jgi:hypothetical protein
MGVNVLKKSTAIVLLFLFCFLARVGYGEGKSKLYEPEVNLFAVRSGGGVELYMIFDLKGSGILCDQPTKTEILKIPSESINPWTFFNQGDFGIVVSQENNNVTNHTIYGSYFYTNEGLGSNKLRTPVFNRKGCGNKSIGSEDSDIYLVNGESNQKIGEMAYMEYINSEGEKRRDLFTRFSETSQWLIQLGDKIFEKEENGSLTQVGYVDWRKITPSVGKQMVILMTKGMDKNSKWSGSYDGKLYKDK